MSGKSIQAVSRSALFRDESPLGQFLHSEGVGNGEARFPARNFLLDEGVLAERMDSYHHTAGVGFPDSDAWVAGHKDYLRGKIALDQNRGVPKKLDPKRADRCPETFRHEAAFRAHGQAYRDLRLVRVVQAEFVSRWGGIDLESLLDAGREVVAANAVGRSALDEAGDLLDSALTVWGERCDLRPVWATFLQDHADLLGPEPAEDTNGWADELRDRLGLSHFQLLSSKSLPILVFSYPVSDVPDRKGFRGKPLAVPTVLDGDLSVAFCPAPGEDPVGRLVHLAAVEREPSREVVHPFFVPEAKHLFRVGEVRRAAPSDLARARARHLQALRNRRADYADSTDADLLGVEP